MKIVIAADTYFPHMNGAANFARRLAYYLNRNGHQIIVIAPSETSKNEWREVDGIPVFGVRSLPVIIYKDFRWSPPFLAKNQIEQIMKKFSPDVVHIQSHFFICYTVFRIAKSLGFPVIGTNHFMPENLTHYLKLKGAAEKMFSNLGWRYFKTVFEKLDAITTPTRSAAKLLEVIGLNREILPISCGIDLEIFKPSNNGDYLKKKYNLPQKKTFLYIGRIDKEKKVDVLIRAFKKALETIDAHFVIAGKGAEVEKLKELTQELGLKNNITFTGFVPDRDLPNLYRVADCFVIAGIAELQSIVTMEAMASGLPVIAVNEMALPELVHDKENGFLFENGNEEQIADDMKKMFTNDDLRKRMSEKSLDIIKEHDIKKVLPIFEKLYKETAKVRV